MEEVLGVHHIAELCECNSDLLNNSEFISTSLRQAVEHANATLLEEVKYEFTPQGITAVCLLSESHISIHTWPEKGYAAVDIFTCGAHTMPERACEYMVQVLECMNPNIKVYYRGIAWKSSPIQIQDAVIAAH
jgi:S-adenosylmethionine decarboxylase